MERTLRLSKQTMERLREALLVSPDKTDDIGEFIIDLDVDVWGGAGPDCRTMPVRAGATL